MSGSAAFVRAIKTRLRTQGISYRELGKLIGVSEPTVKRDLAGGNFSLQRLDRICDALGISVTELIQPGDSDSLTELSEHDRDHQYLAIRQRPLQQLRIWLASAFEERDPGAGVGCDHDWELRDR